MSQKRYLFRKSFFQSTDEEIFDKHFRILSIIMEIISHKTLVKPIEHCSSDSGKVDIIYEIL